MPLIIQPMAGNYAGTYAPALLNPSNLGYLEESGFELSYETKAVLINKTDGYGESLINGIRTGGNFGVRFRCKEFPSVINNQASLLATWPWQSVGNAVLGFGMGTIGDTFDNNAGALVLTATTGTSAAPATLTASMCIVNPATKVSFQLTSKLRELPVDLLFLPYQTNINGPTQTVWFTTL